MTSEEPVGIEPPYDVYKHKCKQKSKAKSASNRSILSQIALYIHCNEGVVVIKVGESVIEVNVCPWCGKNVTELLDSAKEGDDL